MMASRGMGDIAPSKMPTGKRKARRDNTDFTQYKEGGKVNAAGNYTKPGLRKKIVSQVKSAATQGTRCRSVLSRTEAFNRSAWKVSLTRVRRFFTTFGSPFLVAPILQ